MHNPGRGMQLYHTKTIVCIGVCAGVGTGSSGTRSPTPAQTPIPTTAFVRPACVYHNTALLRMLTLYHIMHNAHYAIWPTSPPHSLSAVCVLCMCVCVCDCICRFLQACVYGECQSLGLGLSASHQAHVYIVALAIATLLTAVAETPGWGGHCPANCTRC